MDEHLVGYEALRRRLAALEGDVLGRDIMRTLGNAAKREAGLLAPHKTGNLRRSIDVVDVTPTSARVHARANYAMFVERGTQAHDITPNARKALAFASQGIVNERFGTQKSIFRLSGRLRTGAMRRFGNAAFIVVKRVHHPGTRAQPFLKPGAEAAISKAGLAERVVAAWNDAA